MLVKFNEDERKKLLREIDKIVSLFNEIMSIKDLDSYEPLFHVHDVESHLREDEIIGPVDEARENLASCDIVNGFVKGPRTVVD